MTEVDAIIAKAGVEQEQLAAMLRIVVFLALLATVLSLQQHGAHHYPIMGVTIKYGSLAMIGLLLAWFRIFHPICRYLFLTSEVGREETSANLVGGFHRCSANPFITKAPEKCGIEDVSRTKRSRS